MSDLDDWLSADVPTTADAGSRLPPWKVLVVDDEEEVHRVTSLVLQHFEFEGRGLELLHAYTGREALDVLRRQPDIALALLDVVMEDDHAGLAAARAIREELGNRLVRLVLRTGQPGQAPEHEVFAAYDINDYKEKTELTAQKLKTLLYSSLRSYRDLLEIDGNKQGLARVIDAATRLFEQRELPRFAGAVLAQATELLRMAMGDAGRAVDGVVAHPVDGRLLIAAGHGRYASLAAHYAEDVLPPAAVAELHRALAARRPHFLDDGHVLYYASSSGAEHLLYIANAGPLGEFQRELLELFRANVAVAFENLHLNSDLETAQKEMIYLLGEAIETRSNETGSHVKRVADMSHYLALQAGVDEAHAELIRIASPMHDVGKIGIPDAILNKPGKHTPEEWAVMQDHSRLGYEMLRHSTRRVFQVAASLAHEHHENWDGSGYPRGLRGEQISIEGRVTAVADVLDALLSVRCYKPAWPAEQVRAYFIEQRGLKFDPQLVDILLRDFDYLMELRNSHPD